MWKNAYESARAYYKAERAPSPDNIARNTAWKTVKMYWTEPRKGQFRMRNPNDAIIAGVYKGQTIHAGSQQPLIAPEKSTGLCKLIELSWVAPDGTLQVQRFQEPGLPDVFWNKKKRVLYMFPDLEMGEGVCVASDAPKGRGASRIIRNLMDPLRGGDDVFIGLKDQVKMFKTWSKRKPRCRHDLLIPDGNVTAYGVADTIVYRSDKWEKEPNPHLDKRGSQEYLHQFGLDVAIEETPGDPPPTIIVRGGKLDVLEGGIAH